MNAVQRIEEPMTDLLAEARAARVRVDMQGVTDALTKVRAALDDYERSALERANQRVTCSLLAALGQQDPKTPPPPAENETVEAETVLKAFDELRRFLALPDSPGLDAQEVAAKANPGSLAAALVLLPAFADPPPKPAPLRTLSKLDQDRAEALLDETGRLILGWRVQSKHRLLLLLRAIAADVRDVLRAVPHEHRLFWRLDEIPGRLMAIKTDAGIEEYVKGLSRSSKEDWAKLSHGFRHSLARFAGDLEVPVATTPTPSARPQRPGGAKMGDVLGPQLLKMAGAVEPPAEPKAERWPLLRAGAASKPLLLIGGTTMENRVRAIEERTGFQLDWRKINPGAPRQVANIADTISRGRALGCIIVEGFMSHKDWWPIQNACKQSGMPYAMGDRAGTASTERAFDQLERMLADPPAAIRRDRA